VNGIFAGSLCHFYGECKNEQGSWRNKFRVNWISSFGVMNLKQQSFSSSGRSGSQKNFLYFNLSGWIFFHRFFTKFLNISST
jgi:hypothetical protein